MTCDPNTLSLLASRLRSLSDAQLFVVRTYLLCRWATSGASLNPPSSADITDASTFDAVNVTWVNGSPAGTSNEIWKSTDGVTFALTATVGGGVTSWVDPVAMADGNTWYYKVRSVSGSSSSAFSNTVSVFQEYVSLNVATINFPTLVRAFKQFIAQGLPALTSISLPKLRIVDAHLGLNGNANLASISCPVLKSVGVLFLFGQNPLLTSVNFSSVNDVGSASGGAFGNGSLQFDGCTILASASLPALVSVVGGNISFTSCTALTSITFPLLQSVDTEINFDSCSSLTSANFPALTSIPASNNLFVVSATDCLLCATFSAPLLQTYLDGFAFGFDGQNSLNAASVNQILRNGVLCTNGPLTASSFNLNGTACAAPTGQGLIDKGTLIGQGCTVNTN